MENVQVVFVLDEIGRRLLESVYNTLRGEGYDASDAAICGSAAVSQYIANGGDVEKRDAHAIVMKNAHAIYEIREQRLDARVQDRWGASNLVLAMMMLKQVGVPIAFAKQCHMWDMLTALPVGAQIFHS